MRYSLICMDIDGTLIDDNQLIYDDVKASLANAADMGIRLALISARYPKGVSLVEKQLGLNCIKVSYSGGDICEGDKRLYSRHIDLDSVIQVYNASRRAGAPCWFFADENWYVEEIDDWVINECRIVQNNPEVISFDELVNKWRRGESTPNKITLVTENDILRQAEKEIKASSATVKLGFSSDHYLEVMPAGIDKGLALERICELYAIPLCETIAFGDQETDIPMIKKAGIGIAMGNGIDDLKDSADFVTRSNNESGIYYALDEILNRRKQSW